MKKDNTERIKVLFFISSLEGGGTERVMVDILTHIDKDKIEPLLILLYPFENSPYKEYYKEYLPANLKIKVLKRKSDSFLEKIKQLFNFIRTVYKEKPTVILSMLTHNNILAILANLFVRAKCIVSEHSPLEEVIKTKEGQKMLGLPTKLIVKILYRFAGKIISVSEAMKQYLIDEFKIPENKVIVVYNPLDIERIERLRRLPFNHPVFEKDIPIIIAVGRLVKVKNFDILIKAFKIISEQVNARLVILGDGAERESLKYLIKELGLVDKVYLLGFQNNPFVFLSHSDIFVLSSRYEGLPMAILEAMACGVPVISTDCKSGPREILSNGKYGLLVRVNNVEALAEAMLRLLKDKTLRDRFAMSSAERIKDFSVSKIIKQYEGIIYALANFKK